MRPYNMKVWVCLSVLCLAWSAHFELSAWTAYLEFAFPTFLPKLTEAEGKICYFFDTTQTCSGQAISDILGKPVSTDIPTGLPLSLSAKHSSMDRWLTLNT